MAQERDDAGLVLATRAGDGTAFGILFDRWFDRVWDVAWHVVRDREVAAEVAQDVFLVAWQRIDDLREPAAFGGWLLRTSRNRALNRLERERRTTPAGGPGDALMAALPDPGTDPATAAEDGSRDELVWAAAAALGERDASVLDLHLRHGLAPGEIAEALDVAPNHAHQLLFRLKERLATAIRSCTDGGITAEARRTVGSAEARVAGPRGRRGCGGRDHWLGRRTRWAGRRRGAGHGRDRCHGQHCDRSRRLDTPDAASQGPVDNDIDHADHGRARHRHPRVTTAPPTDPTTTTDPPAPPTDPPAPPTIGGFRASLQRGACE
jgi:RNA polymerase sigma factor (sigma-70 family)